MQASVPAPYHFGRYNDLFKAPDRRILWEHSLQAYQENRYLESYRLLLEYLNDSNTNNVQIQPSGDTNILHFSFLQGSNIITGWANHTHIEAHSVLAIMPQLNMPVMRLLLESNYKLQFTRFALHDNNEIVLKFSAAVIDTPPEKLQTALRELAVQADKKTDLFKDSFAALQHIRQVEKTPVSEEQKELRYQFFCRWIDEALAQVNQMDTAKNAAEISYRLLTTAYRIDVLLLPEGKLMDEMEQIHAAFFNMLSASETERNAKIMQIFERLRLTPKENIIKNFYTTVSTFGVSGALYIEDVASLLQQELSLAQRAFDAKNEALARVILEYTALHLLFLYALPPVITEVLKLVVELLNFSFFKTMQPPQYNLVQENNTLDKEKILNRLEAIKKIGKERKEKVSVRKNSLAFDNTIKLVISLLSQINDLYSPS